jgi:type IV pilus assembly protein PilV
MMKTPQRKQQQAGFSLIEILVTILICSIGLLGIIGLQARAIQHSVGAEDITRAMRLSDEAVWAIHNQRSVPLNLVAQDAWKTKVQSEIPNGEGIMSDPDANGIVRITVKWSPPDAASGAEPRQYITEVASAQ